MQGDSLQHELIDLAFAVCDGIATDEQIERIEQLLAGDPAARLLYLQCLEMHLDMDRHTSMTPSSRQPGDPDEVNPDEVIAKQGQGLSEPTGAPLPIVIDPSPSNPYPLSTNLFSSYGFLFSYGVAAVIMGIGMLIAWACKLPVGQEVVTAVPHRAPMAVHAEPEIAFVGRITGMVDCRWADPATEPFNGARVPSGRKYALAAGLMEITYDAGAKVILQGPCTYKVESAHGGYLSVGRLTAIMETRAESGNRGVTGHETPNHSIGNPHIAEPPSALPLFSSSAPFFVRTPTALVTDLGTEFGVEYDKSGVTRSLVFRGAVKLQAASADGKTRGSARTLHEDQSARVEKTGIITGGGGLEVALGPSAKPGDFVRKMPKRTIKVFDLVDVVAGGDGFSGRRDRGISPTTGEVAEVPSEKILASDGKYHRVAGLPFVDGIFIPKGRNAVVQLDSAGHTFAEFNNSEDKTGDVLMGGGRLTISPPLAPPRENIRYMPAVLDGVDYSSPPHGLLFLHANKGVTFDLEAIRRANPGCKLLRFRAVAANAEVHTRLMGSSNSADAWVFLDGRECFRRKNINGYSGAAPVAVPIGERNRYLTLVGTDGGDGISADWIMFGDPRIEMISDAKSVPDLAPNTSQPRPPKSEEVLRK